MKSLWIVYGQSGEYSDHREWSVCGYPTEELAKRHAALAQARAAELYRRDRGWCNIPDGANQFDDQMGTYASDVEYGVYMLEVRDDLPA